MSPSPRFASKTNKTPALPTVTIDQIARGDNILLVGNKGSGKSTLLDALVKLRDGTTVVIDPHHSPGSWQGARVVGAGRDYESIATFLGDVEKSLSARYREMAKGKRQFHRLTICGDEWRSITQKVDGAGGVFASVITEGRKVRLCVLAASHNDTVSSLGCKGDKDSFMNSFDWIVYTGAFATQRLPSTMEIPLIPTEHGDIPALAFAVNVNQQKDYALDLRDVTTSTVLTEQDKQNLLNNLLLGTEQPPERSKNRGACSGACSSVLGLANGKEKSKGESGKGDSTNENSTPKATNEEIERTRKVVELIADGHGKAKSIEIAWDCTRGSSKAYKRGDYLYQEHLAGKLPLDTPKGNGDDLLDGYLGDRQWDGEDGEG